MKTMPMISKGLQSVDNASLTFFRIGFGALAATWGWDYLAAGRTHFLYVEPRFFFSYDYFDWVRPWPGPGMYLHFLALIVLAVCIACGAFYRIATLLFAIGFTYVFLLDRTNYQNHYYLLALISWSLVFLPLHRNVSVDAWLRPALRSQTAPAWSLWLTRFHIMLPYFFGGVAKLSPDWLVGEPMRTMLAGRADIPLLGHLLASELAVWLFSWGGLLFDLAVVPLLLWRPTRPLAYSACVAFHLTNSLLFQIHVFPWFMILATTIFFEPDWPRRVLGGAALPIAEPDTGSAAQSRSSAWKLKLAAGLLVVYAVFHVTWPLRCTFYSGDTNWTEQGHLFSWRMMLRGKTGGVRYFITDPATKQTWLPDLRVYLNPEQFGKFPRDPELILQLAHHLAEEQRAELGRDVEVRALVLLSLNGRKPQLLIDPNVNLVHKKRGERTRPWVLPQSEPLRYPGWDLPLLEWEKHVTIPPLEFLMEAPLVRRENGTTASVGSR